MHSIVNGLVCLGWGAGGCLFVSRVQCGYCGKTQAKTFLTVNICMTYLLLFLKLVLRSNSHAHTHMKSISNIILGVFKKSITHWCASWHHFLLVTLILHWLIITHIYWLLFYYLGMLPYTDLLINFLTTWQQKPFLCVWLCTYETKFRWCSLETSTLTSFSSSFSSLFAKGEKRIC